MLSAGEIGSASNSERLDVGLLIREGGGFISDGHLRNGGSGAIGAEVGYRLVDSPLALAAGYRQLIPGTERVSLEAVTDVISFQKLIGGLDYRGGGPGLKLLTDPRNITRETSVALGVIQARLPLFAENATWAFVTEYGVGATLDGTFAQAMSLAIEISVGE